MRCAEALEHPPPPKPDMPIIWVAAAALIDSDNRILIAQRPDGKSMAGLWEFPGGKIKKHEKPIDALKRELKEELNIEVKSPRALLNVKHFYTQFRVNLHVFSCVPKVLPKIDMSRKWLKLNNLRKYPMPSGSSKIVDRLLAM